MSKHPVSDEKLAIDFPEYVRRLAARLRKGADDYGDGSFTKRGPELCEELAQELMDICGWGFVLWTRIKDLENKLRAVEEQLDAASRSLPPSPLHSPVLQQSKLSEFLSFEPSKLRLGEP